MGQRSTFFKLNLFLGAALLCGGRAQAGVPGTSFGLLGGITKSKYDLVGTTATAGSGYLAGLSLNLLSMSPISIEIDALYALRKGTYTSAGVIGGTAFSASGSLQLPQVYVPVLLKISMLHFFSLKLGGYYAQGIGNVTHSTAAIVVAGTTVSPASSSKAAYGSASGVKAADYGAAVGLGLGFGPLTLEGRYSFGLANLASSGVIKGRYLDLLAGLHF
jgi:hypothetical protein